MASNTFAIKDVMDLTIEEYNASGRGTMLFHADYAKNTNIASTAERLSIRGGINNYKIIDLDHTKDTTVNIMLPIVDINALAVKLGVDVSTGAKRAVKTQTITVGATPTITLASTPLAGSIKIHKVINERDFGDEQTAGTPSSTPNEYSIAGEVITLNATTAAEGTKFFVSYDYTSGVNAQNIKITANDFPSFITLRGTGFVDDTQVKGKVPVSFIIHKAKVKPEFELTMASDAATELPFDCDCYTVINTDGDREYIDIVKLNDETV